MYKNSEGYPDPTAGKAIRQADKPPGGGNKLPAGHEIDVCYLPCASAGEGNRCGRERQAVVSEVFLQCL